MKLQRELVAVGEEAAQSRLDAAFRLSGKDPDLDFDDFETDLATTLNYLGILNEEAGRKSEAVAYHDEAAKILDRLIKGHPGLPRWDAERALTSNYLGELRGSNEELKSARETFDRLLAEDSEIPRLRAGLARNLAASGLMAAASGRTADGIALLRRAETAQKSLVAEQPENFDFRQDLIRTRKGLDAIPAP